MLISREQVAGMTDEQWKEYTAFATELQQLRANEARTKEHVQQLEAANATLGGELLQASRERQEALDKLQAEVDRLKHLTETVCRQRNICFDTVRAILAGYRFDKHTGRVVQELPSLSRALAEARELVTIVEAQLKK